MHLKIDGVEWIVKKHRTIAVVGCSAAVFAMVLVDGRGVGLAATDLSAAGDSTFEVDKTPEKAIDYGDPAGMLEPLLLLPGAGEPVADRAGKSITIRWKGEAPKEATDLVGVHENGLVVGIEQVEMSYSELDHALDQIVENSTDPRAPVTRETRPNASYSGLIVEVDGIERLKRNERELEDYFSELTGLPVAIELVKATRMPLANVADSSFYRVDGHLWFTADDGTCSGQCDGLGEPSDTGNLGTPIASGV